MRYCVGIDLGSTTTKAVILDDDGEILGRGITNSRSNYEVARDVSVSEALIDARFGLVRQALATQGDAGDDADGLLNQLEQGFRESQYRRQLGLLCKVLKRLASDLPAPIVVASGGGCHGIADAPTCGSGGDVAAPSTPWEAAETILTQMQAEAGELFTEGSSRKSDFFRDLAGGLYLGLAEGEARRSGVPYDQLVGLYDKAILEVENEPPTDEDFGQHMAAALSNMAGATGPLERAVARAADTPLEQAVCVGTGYGRATLPFEKEHIRSEILCHGLGAHAMFPGTRTVLDIGGQDTKAIQVDDRGIVTSFQMNDRCAAGCGRYLGYIADEMNLGLHELGPLACESKRPVKINSTCTVFAGAELRERLSLGEERADILAGLHRSIVLRAMSLLARSGGVDDEFTFTGGVAKNPAAVNALAKLVHENYGELTLNISPDSIYTGALGAALFAFRSLADDVEADAAADDSVAASTPLTTGGTP
ncbi:MAG: benzoyl-CoA reductase subunit A [Planctomycetota bacterium]|nr:MAG: benzoyl-CoA reductase subunit A [Planctomycetota bacterium]